MCHRSRRLRRGWEIRAARSRVRPPRAKYKAAQARQRLGDARRGGPLELVGDTAMLFEEYLLQGECSLFTLEWVLALGRGQEKSG